MPRKLVLFDVDGTLITRSRLHPGEAFSEGFSKAYGLRFEWKDDERMGMTDKGIIMEVLREKGFSRKVIDAELSQMYAVMTKYVEERIEKDKSSHEIPHVYELLAELEMKGDILGLVTGNVERIAWLKLKKAGLADFFQLGGFGDSSDKRSELVQNAIRKAEEKFKTRIGKSDIFVIGDTPLDIEAGKQSGVKTIAMATGTFTLFELKKHNPDFAFPDYSNPEKIVQAIHKD